MGVPSIKKTEIGCVVCGYPNYTTMEPHSRCIWCHTSQQNQLSTLYVISLCGDWSGRPDSNQRPRRPEGKKVTFCKSRNNKYLLVLTGVKHCWIQLVIVENIGYFWLLWTLFGHLKTLPIRFAGKAEYIFFSVIYPSILGI